MSPVLLTSLCRDQLVLALRLFQSQSFLMFPRERRHEGRARAYLALIGRQAGAPAPYVLQGHQVTRFLEFARKLHVFHVDRNLYRCIRRDPLGPDLLATMRPDDPAGAKFFERVAKLMVATDLFEQANEVHALSDEMRLLWLVMAAEALFIDDDKSELSYRLATRMAFLNGAGVEEVKRTIGDIKAILGTRRVRLDHGLVGDIGDTLRALVPKLSEHSDDRHLKAALEDYRKARKDLDELVLNEVAAPDAIFSCDVGTPTLWAARYLAMNGRRRLLGSFNHGSMANALPQAIGAQLTHRERQVIALSGDGGLAMLMGDLLTLRQHELPVKVVVFRNDALAFVELEMKAAGILDFATGLRNPDFAKMAEAAGLLGLSAETPEQVRPMFDKALAHHGPALVEVHVARQELAMPPSITLEQAAGFGLFMLRAVLSGRGDEIIDLAKVNVLRQGRSWITRDQVRRAKPDPDLALR